MADTLRTTSEVQFAPALIATNSHIPGSNISILQSQWIGHVNPSSASAAHGPATVIEPNEPWAVGRTSLKALRFTRTCSGT